MTDTTTDNGDTPVSDEAAAEEDARHTKASNQSRFQIETNRIRRYLTALDRMADKPFRGLKTQAYVEQRIADIPAEIHNETDPVKRLMLVQERFDRQAELEAIGTSEEFAQLEADFIAVAKDFSERKGVSYAAWRHVRVEADVLTKAGIKRGA